MIAVAVDHRDVDGRASQAARRSEAAEARADDHDTRTLFCRPWHQPFPNEKVLARITCYSEGTSSSRAVPGSDRRYRPARALPWPLG